MDELSTLECRDLLGTQEVGRVAVCTPQGPQIMPVNYVVDGASLIFRTSPYGVLGRHAWNSQIAFQIDHVDTETRSGWSVLATGSGEMIEDAEELAVVRAFRNPQPWASGSRLLYVRLAWDELTGRRIGSA